MGLPRYTYTEEQNGAVHGMEDAPITPFSCDMSASGDGMVAALLRMLTVQPDLITDKGYSERTIPYGIDCGVIDQWLVAHTRSLIQWHKISNRKGIPHIGRVCKLILDVVLIHIIYFVRCLRQEMSYHCKLN